MIYLNQAGTSWPKPAAVQRAVAEALEGSPEEWSEVLESQHREVCRWFGVEDPSRLLLTPGATSALAVAITDHAWQRGDQIIISGFEHHALHRPVQQLMHGGVEIVVVPPAGGAPVCLETLEQKLRGGPVRMVAMTAASNVTGDLLPVDEIVAMARRYGALSLIDAAQIAGWMPIDADRFGADLLVFTGHKGPQGPWGIGGLYVGPQVTMATPRAVCEIPMRTATGTTGGALCSPMPGFCDVGSVNRVALAGLVAALRWLAAPERSGRLSRARGLTARLADAAAEFAAVKVHGFQSPERRMPTVALTFRDRSPGEVGDALRTRGVIAAVGLQCAPLAHETLGTSPDGVLRLSVGPSNDDEDVSAAIDALREILGG